MSFVWATCRKDWRRRRRDPVGMLLWIAIPVFIGAVLSLLTGGRDGPKPQALVLVADHDDSALSGFLVGALSQDRVGGVMRAESVDEEEGRRRVEAGKATALLVIPAGFGDAVLRETPTTLTLRTNPAERVLPGIVEESLGALGDGVFYLHRVLGEELTEIVDGPAAATPTLRDVQVSDLAVRIHHVVERVQGTLFPPVIALATGPSVDTDDAAPPAATTATTDTTNPDPESSDPSPKREVSFALLFVPGLLFMSFLFMAQGLAEDLWVEREARTLQRAILTPQRPAALLVGKVLAGAGVILVVAAVALAVAWGWFGLAWPAYPGAVLWSAFSGTFLLLMFVVLHVHVPTRRGASVLSTAVVFPLMMLGGSFFPFEAMPAWMVAIGRWTPNGWALARLKDLLLERADPAQLVRSAGMLAALGLLFFIVAARRLGATFARS